MINMLSLFVSGCSSHITSKKAMSLKDSTWYDSSQLVASAARGNMRVLKQMLGKGVNVNTPSNGRTALISAAENGHAKAVRLIISAGADVNKGLLFAARTGNVNCVSGLIAAGADVNKTDSSDCGTALIAASYRGHDHCVDVLIQAGADVNLVGGIAETPVDHTLEYIFIFMLETGNDGRDYQKNIGGFTPLSAASSRGHDKCIELLLSAGADVNRIDIWGFTPLIAASRGGHFQCVETLIKAGGRVNLVSGHGAKTALMVASWGGHQRCTQILIKAGADVNQSDRNRKTPLGYAYEHIEGRAMCVENGYKTDVSSLTCIRLLLREGAEINRCGRIGFDFLLTRTEVRAARKFQAHMKPVGQLLFAAGETQLIKDLTHQEPETESLMGMCRDRIRTHLLRLDAHAHLFHRVRRLGLPAALQKYILFDQTIDETEDEKNKKASRPLANLIFGQFFPKTA